MAAKRAIGAEKRELFEAEALPHLDAVYTMAVRLARNSDDANDLVQETVLRAWRFFDQFEPGTNCRAWLFTILFNNFRNGYRRSSREQPAASLDDFEHRIETQSVTNEPKADDPESLVAEQQPIPEVETAVAALPEEFRSALLLVDVEEMSYDDVAQVLNVPIGTVKSRVSRGRALLREALRGYVREFGIKRS